MDELSFAPRCPACNSNLPAVRRPAGIMTSGTTTCPSCKLQISLRVNPDDNRLYVRMITLPVGAPDPGELVFMPSASATPPRKKPASSRTAALPELRESGDLREHLAKNFAPPEWKYDYFLTPAELCDIAERYEAFYVVKFNDHDCRLSAERDALVKLEWKATPDINAITLVGLYVFRTPSEAKTVWTDKGVFDDSVPVARALDIRDRYALNFKSGSYSYTLRDLQEIPAAELWPRICRYCQEVGAPIES